MKVRWEINCGINPHCVCLFLSRTCLNMLWCLIFVCLIFILHISNIVLWGLNLPSFLSFDEISERNNPLTIVILLFAFEFNISFTWPIKAHITPGPFETATQSKSSRRNFFHYWIAIIHSGSIRVFVRVLSWSKTSGIYKKKLNTRLFIKIDVVPFKEIPIDCNAYIPTVNPAVISVL